MPWCESKGGLTMRVRGFRRIVFAGLVLGLAIVGRGAIYRSLPEEEPDLYGPVEPRLPELSDPVQLRAIREAGDRIRPLHRAKSPPVAGDWLFRQKESGQSFDEYRTGQPNLPGRRLTTLYVRPWGEFDGTRSGMVDWTGEMLGLFYGLPVERLGPWSLETVPAFARPKHPDRGDERLATGYALDRLLGKRPGNAVSVLSLTTVDLAPGEGRGWVFGQASVFTRVGICSFYRHGDPEAEPTTFLRRTLKTALHEVGHTLGIVHCTAYECGMNGCGSRGEADSRPLGFCPECEMKVWWGCRLDPEERYTRLIGFARMHDLDLEAKTWGDSLAALRGRKAGGVAAGGTPSATAPHEPGAR